MIELIRDGERERESLTISVFREDGIGKIFLVLMVSSHFMKIQSFDSFIKPILVGMVLY